MPGRPVDKTIVPLESVTITKAQRRKNGKVGLLKKMDIVSISRLERSVIDNDVPLFNSIIRKVASDAKTMPTKTHPSDEEDTKFTMQLTPLHLACSKGHGEIINEIFKHEFLTTVHLGTVDTEADVHTNEITESNQDYEKHNLLRQAIQAKHSETSYAWKARTIPGISITDFNCVGWYKSCQEVGINVLNDFKNDGSVLHEWKWRETSLLHVLARQGCKNIIKVLVDGGEHLNFVDTITEVTPLMYALCYENVDVVETLISHNQLNKADPTKRCNLPGISENISPIECATESKNTRLVNMISLAIADHNKDLEGKAEDSDNSHQLDKTKEVQENHSTQQKVSTNDSADTEVLEDAIELPTSETLHNGNSNANTITTEAKVDLTKKMSTDYSSSNTIGKPSITQNAYIYTVYDTCNSYHISILPFKV
eukprot:g1248.t1